MFWKAVSISRLNACAAILIRMAYVGIHTDQMVVLLQFRYVTGCYMYLMITTNKINLLKYSFTSKLKSKILDVWNRISIRCSNAIEPPIITTRTPTTIRYGYNMKRRSPRTIRLPDDTHLLHFKKLSLCYGEFIWR